MENIKEQPNPKMVIDFDDKQPAEDEKQVKVLVPSHTDGKIVGKDDSYIKQIGEEFGSSKDGALPDLRITVIDETENGKAGSSTIMSNIVEDPQSGSCENVDYADFTGPVENLKPIDSLFANPGNVCFDAVNNSDSFNSSLNSLNPTVANSFQFPQASATYDGCLSLLSPTESRLVIEKVKNCLFNIGFTETAISEISSAMDTLAKYGLLHTYEDFKYPHFGSTVAIVIPVSDTSTIPMMPREINQDTYTPNSVLSNVEAACNSVSTYTPLGFTSSAFGSTGSFDNGMSGMGIGPSLMIPNVHHSSNHSLEQAEANVYDPFRNTFSINDSLRATALPVNENSFGLGTGLSSSPAALPVNENSFGLGTGLSSSPAALERSLQLSNIQEKERIQFEVPDNVVGAIIGCGGKIITRIKNTSGAAIYISERGKFAPGTNNRIVTIVGLPSAVNKAKFLIEQRIPEKYKRQAEERNFGHRKPRNY